MIQIHLKVKILERAHNFPSGCDYDDDSGEDDVDNNTDKEIISVKDLQMNKRMKCLRKRTLKHHKILPSFCSAISRQN